MSERGIFHSRNVVDTLRRWQDPLRYDFLSFDPSQVEAPYIPEIGKDGSMKDTARRIFVDASIHYAASGIAQAAAINLASRGTVFHPDELGNSLLEDTAEILKLTDIANNAHRNLDPSRLSVPIIPLDIRRTIRADFRYASEMMNLDPTIPLWILDRYPQIISSKRLKNERKYRAYVIKQANQARKRGNS